MKSRSCLLVLLGGLFAAGVTLAIFPGARPAGLMSALIRTMHGAPPARPPGPPDAAAATISFAPGLAPDTSVTDFLKAFAEALRIHNGSGLKSRLSARYTIEGLPPDAEASDFFFQAVAKFPSTKEIVVRSIESRGDLRVVTAEFRSPEGTAKNRVFQFDADGKLVSADFFSLQRQAHGM